ncbi:hypothetical protein SISNIDRAFT_469143 [Sistotremastrum niveocremeum HHB9708]|uniref:Uncharacterized protein n=1 Tax=Sistotremastrum niveocremeum HHB9708 TaxID=1314777 RepID=A0A164QG46_9AGAM|nr:hypothetical protein SISNIDRAFT_469143 [Sistotremastrum niveocremeum HHB9708]
MHLLAHTGAKCIISEKSTESTKSECDIRLDNSKSHHEQVGHGMQVEPLTAQGYQDPCHCDVPLFLESQAFNPTSEISSPGASLRVHVIAAVLRNGEVSIWRDEYARVIAPDHDVVHLRPHVKNRSSDHPSESYTKLRSLVWATIIPKLRQCSTKMPSIQFRIDPSREVPPVQSRYVGDESTLHLRPLRVPECQPI